MKTLSDQRPVLCIVDDDDAFRDSLVTMLAQEPFDILASASAEAFLDRLPDHRTGCALIDLHMPCIDGFELLRRLVERDFPLPVIMITGHGDVRSAVRAIKAGAIDFIEKPVDRVTLLALVDNAFMRSRQRSSAEDDRVAFAIRLRRLTDREHEVLDRMLGGKPNKIIARELAISPRTVEIHRARVMHKLEADSMAQLVRCATRAALVNDAAT